MSLNRGPSSPISTAASTLNQNGKPGLRFYIQLGLAREVVEVSAEEEMSLPWLQEQAFKFVDKRFPEHGFYGLADKLQLFRHDLNDPNILKIMRSIDELVDGVLIEVVVSAQTTMEDLQVRPHQLFVRSYKSPHFCDFCGEMLWGIVKQGLKCEGCGLNCHKRCAYKIANNCSKVLMRKSSTSSSRDLCPATPDTTVPSVSASQEELPQSSRTKSWSGRPMWVDSSTFKGIKVPHTFVVHNYKKLTKCQYCKKLLRGLFRQGVQCKDCRFNAHKKCSMLVPRNCQGETFYETSEPGDTEDASSLDAEAEAEPCTPESPSELPSDLDDETKEKDPLSPSPSSNIPLMRVVQSVRHTKRKGSSIIREGWMVHFTNKDPTRKRHYWRLDTKSVVLHTSDQSSRYHKEIKLSEIVCVESARFVNAELLENTPAPHVFEIHMPNLVFMVGEDRTFGGRQEASLCSAESGVGLEQGLAWESALRQALLPLTPQASTDPGATRSTEPQAMEKQRHSVKDISVLYQIYPEEILGSGQFGVVYGGKHKVKGNEVAIKVIDKLKFPTKSKMDNEVAILQDLHHPGVVNLEKKFETIEKIFVVMEKLKGDMLEMILNCPKGRLTERVTKFLISQVLAALKYLHTKNIVHCDLKPENVLLSSEVPFPQVKLCDFGYARIIGEKSFRRSVVGTPAYLAPEVLKDKGYNRSLDMWSVGVIIYVSLSGTFPFNEDEEIADQIQNAAFMYPVNPWSEISKEAPQLIQGLLQIERSKRLGIVEALDHEWMQDYQMWCDLRKLEAAVGQRYLTHTSDDARWETYRVEHSLPPWQTLGHKGEGLHIPSRAVKA